MPLLWHGKTQEGKEISEDCFLDVFLFDGVFFHGLLFMFVFMVLFLKLCFFHWFFKGFFLLMGLFNVFVFLNRLFHGFSGMVVEIQSPLTSLALIAPFPGTSFSSSSSTAGAKWSIFHKGQGGIKNSDPTFEIPDR